MCKMKVLAAVLGVGILERAKYAGSCPFACVSRHWAIMLPTFGVQARACACMIVCTAARRRRAVHSIA